MKLSTLLENSSCQYDSTLAELSINRIVFDTRQVTAGSLFVALRGNRQNGHEFIQEAMKRGAVAALVDDPAFASPRMILVDDTRRLLPELAQRFFNYPAQDISLYGITGTNGKSTTAWLIFEMLRQISDPVGLIGTIQTRIDDTWFQNELTTPDPLFLAQFLRYLVDVKGSDCVMEVSSHGIDQKRVQGLQFHTLLFTNLSPEHLDYHHDIEEYFSVKASLMRDHPDSKRIVNIDTEWGQRLAHELNGAVTISCLDEQADFFVAQTMYGNNGTRFTVRHQGFGVVVNSPLLGAYNVENALAALVALAVNGTPLVNAARLLENAAQIPGRLERSQLPGGGALIIDYAHTPDAFARLFEEVERLGYENVITIFGAGGERDRSKRPLMGELACRYSDHLFLTDDNPRHEDPAIIVQDILSGCDDEKVEVIHDRAEAIQTALTQMTPDTLLLLLGKGHETYQVIGDDKQYFNEREIIAAATR
jgi:UDP-N-acetylmuramoyl-L-alanyl-D-glutamate--2,6-diaminopimelate ligase